MSSNNSVSRRGILKAGALATVPFIVPSSVFGKDAPSNRVALAMIGVGRQGRQVNLRTLLNMDGVQITDVCEVDKWRLGNAKGDVDKKYENKDCLAHGDWREVIARDDVDAVMISTTDHWHVPMALAAVRAGKHVSCEKPLSMSIAEGQLLAKEAKKAGVVFRTDSECRTHAYMHKTAQLVRNGYLGNIKRMEVGVPLRDVPGGNGKPTPVPAELDYELWRGPAPMKEYCVDRVHPSKSYGRPDWMRCRDTCEGVITNWGTHLIDVAQQANNTERTGPVSIEGTGTYPKPGSGIWNVLVNFKVQYTYASGVVLDYVTKEPYLRIEGDEGWIEAHWHSKGGLTAHDKSIFRTKWKDSDIMLPQRTDKGDFIHCIQNNAPEQSMADAEVGHRTCAVGQLGHIAIQLGRKLEFDPKTENFMGDAEANKMLSKSYREPWGLSE